MSVETKIKSKLKLLQDLLITKNRNYGNSALVPANIFSRLSSMESIKIRIDDKLKRIENKGVNDETEDTVMDLAGYLILLMIARDDQEIK
tara:strand:+ start:4361 stop:4630 length:270 start_codon:yes stop_codon:yes gene_type:complete